MPWGQVILDITAERVKQVKPHVGFVGEKRDLTAEELDLLSNSGRNAGVLLGTVVDIKFAR
jgi:hypothetical protein